MGIQSPPFHGDPRCLFFLTQVGDRGAVLLGTGAIDLTAACEPRAILVPAELQLC